MIAAATQKMGKPELAHKAIKLAEKRLSKDEWPEYYDGKTARLVGKEARRYQTWTVAGYLLALELMENPEHLKLVCFDEYPQELPAR